MIVVFGSRGQLGRDLIERLPQPLQALTREEVDLLDFAKVREILNELKPRTVINCAAYNFVDLAESDPNPCFQANTWAVKNLAEVCRDLDATFVTYSTDYVFGLESTRTQPWNETDAPGPVSNYGLSKLNGEFLVRSICPKHLVIRTCGLYGLWGSGGKGGNFVETMLKLAGQGNPLKIVDDQRCTPSFTLDIADATAQLLEANANGLFHLTNSGDCSWFEFATTIFRSAGLNPTVDAVPSSQFPRPARRPAYSVLSLQRAESILGQPLPHWTDAVGRYLQIRASRK